MNIIFMSQSAIEVLMLVSFLYESSLNLFFGIKMEAFLNLGSLSEGIKCSKCHYAVRLKKNIPESV